MIKLIGLMQVSYWYRRIGHWSICRHRICKNNGKQEPAALTKKKQEPTAQTNKKQEPAAQTNKKQERYDQIFIENLE
jgi:hypothetical protein